MNTTTITIKTTEKTKKEVQKIADEMGVSLSVVIDDMLKQLVKKRTVTKKKEGKLTDWAIEELRKSEEDVKAGRVVSFKNGKDAVQYLRNMIANEDTRKKS